MEKQVRFILTILLVCFVLPAMAQQERECRGKQTFDLGDGSNGCLLEIGTSAITTTRSKATSGASRSTKQTSGEIVVAMFGAHSASRQVIGNRLRTICQTFLPQVQQDLANVQYHRIVVRMLWPRVKNSGEYIPVDRLEMDMQVAFSSSTCRGIRFFGR